MWDVFLLIFESYTSRSHLWRQWHHSFSWFRVHFQSSPDSIYSQPHTYPASHKMRGPREHETMSIVVEQTIPFSREALDVENPTRWIKLLPLVRPSFRAIQVQDHTILVDEALKSSQDVRVAIIGRHGNFSSKVLESRHVCAVAFDATGKSTLDAAHMMLALGAAGFEPGPGSVVLRCGRQRRATRSNGILTVEVEGCMALDHLLHLIGCSTAETRYLPSPHMARKGVFC